MTDTREKLLWPVFLGGAGVVFVFNYWLFSGFFPGPNGLGHDYSGGLPGLLAEYYWSLREGPFEPLWFTPAFCGGIPGFADPGGGFYSFPSLLVRLLPIGPTEAFFATLLVFSGLGYAGLFVFARSVSLSVWAAALAAILFALNGFHTSRMLVGHTGFHGFMLVPWLAWCMTFRGAHSALQVRSEVAGAAVLAGLVFAYWFHSGAASLLLPLLLSSMGLMLIALLKGASFGRLVIRGAAAAVVGVGLVASKLSASMAYLANFPRSDYKLPGFASFWDSLQFGFLTLFASPADIAPWVSVRVTNLQWALDRQELENGVTWVPLILLALALGAWLSRRSGQESQVPHFSLDDQKIDFAALSYWSALILILMIPLAINTYGESWNAFLKSVPLIGSSSSVIRWYFLYIPLVVLAAGSALDYLSDRPSARRNTAIVGIFAALFLMSQVDREFYKNQSYDPKPVESAFLEARKTPGFAPQIQYVGAFVDASGQVQLTGNRNDLLTQGISQLACYVPIFGYRLEHFPFKSLRPGPSLEVTDGVLNVKNPACFVFPKENACQPGDHFTASDISRAQRFLNYQSIAFKKSDRQILADRITQVTLVMTTFLLLFFIFGLIRKKA
jgi:hypothetical protein